jgi:hypothetical protein
MRSADVDFKARTTQIKDTSADTLYKLIERTFLTAYFAGSSSTDLEGATLQDLGDQYKTMFRTCPLSCGRIFLCLCACVCTYVLDPSKFEILQKQIEKYCQQMIKDEELGEVGNSVPEVLEVELPSYFTVTCGQLMSNYEDCDDYDVYHIKEEFLLLRFLQLYKMEDPRAKLYMSELREARLLVDDFEERSKVL